MIHALYSMSSEIKWLLCMRILFNIDSFHMSWPNALSVNTNLNLTFTFMHLAGTYPIQLLYVAFNVCILLDHAFPRIPTHDLGIASTMLPFQKTWKQTTFMRILKCFCPFLFVRSSKRRCERELNSVFAHYMIVMNWECLNAHVSLNPRFLEIWNWFLIPNRSSKMHLLGVNFIH